MPGKPGELPKKNEDGKWVWSDGSEMTPAEGQAIMGAAEGGTPAGGAADTSVTGTTFLPGSSDVRLNSSSPGAQLDTGLMDQDRARLGGLLEQLQQQAATGDGAWQQTFKDATAKSGAAAQAIGQSTPGTSYQSQLRGIGDAQGAVAQKAVGQENILRNQAKQDATSQLSDIYANQGAMDVDQAKASAGVRQDVRTVNDTQDKANDKNNGDFVSALGQTFTNFIGLSDGGPVPGQPQVFGDDEQNDTVPAMLSPGEVVLPRTISHDPAAAADFVRSLNAQKGGVQHFAEGGQAEPWRPGDLDPTSQVKDENGVTRDKGPESPLPWVTTSSQAPSIENGGVLESGNFMESRAGNLANDQAFLAQTQGQGPSIAGQQNQDANDAALAAAMQNQAAGRGQRQPVGASIMQGAQQSQAAAGQAGATMGREASGAQGDLAKSILRQRQIDSTMAQNQQVAAFRNTMANAGISLEQMAQMKGIISAGGQAVTGLASVGENMPDDNDSGFESDLQADESGERGGLTDLSEDDPEFKAHGGVVGEDIERRKARDFIASLRGGR